MSDPIGGGTSMPTNPLRHLAATPSPTFRIYASCNTHMEWIKIFLKIVKIKYDTIHPFRKMKHILWKLNRDPSALFNCLSIETSIDNDYVTGSYNFNLISKSKNAREC